MPSPTREWIIQARQAARSGWQGGDVDGALALYEGLIGVAARDYSLFHDVLYPDADRILAEALTLALLPGVGEADPARARRYAKLATSHHAGSDHERVGWAEDFDRIGDRESALILVSYLRKCRGVHAAWIPRHPRLSALTDDPHFQRTFADLEPRAVTARNMIHLGRRFGDRSMPDDLRTMLTVYWTGRWKMDGLLREVRFLDESEELPGAPRLPGLDPGDLAHQAVVRHFVPVLRPSDQYVRHRTVGYWLHPDQPVEAPPPVVSVGRNPGEYKILGTGCSLAEALVWTLYDMEIDWRNYMRVHEGETYDEPDEAILASMVAWFDGCGITLKGRPSRAGVLAVHPKTLFDDVYRTEMARARPETQRWAWFAGASRKAGAAHLA